MLDLGGQDVERPDDRDTGGHHRGELPGKNHELLDRDRGLPQATEARAALLLVDGQDHALLFPELLNQDLARGGLEQPVMLVSRFIFDHVGKRRHGVFASRHSSEVTCSTSSRLVSPMADFLRPSSRNVVIPNCSTA